jgi:hypothetical protein
MSTTTMAFLEPRITAWPCRIIISRVTPTVFGRPCTDHAHRVAHQHQVAMVVEDLGHRRGVGGQADDRRLALT